MTLNLPVRSVYPMSMFLTSYNGSAQPTPYSISSINNTDTVVIQPFNKYGTFVSFCNLCNWGLVNGGVRPVVTTNTNTNDWHVQWKMIPVLQTYVNATSHETICSCQGPDCPECLAAVQGTNYTIKYQVCSTCNYTVG